ncbi:phosphomannomutase [Frankia sp. EI5c]|uniref:phospho-sugar mutase n=1 Tax=Frankia sp. EI5c TaxID=683316 RepID=UPI0007C37C88|nr:phospho-sugar mutase [Frankia sp. EI5c]OAA24398.1 phosphomannomutase [Frankia sp. EI5c]
MPGDLPAGLAGQVESWLRADPDPGDRAELSALVAAGDVQGIRERFAGPLTFGTAGLRGPLRAGPAGMNTAVVRRTTAGLAGWLRGRSGARPVVVIGHDARLRGDQFALDAARVLAAAGVRALLLPAPLPTPVLAFAVRQLGADAGVMITASHNPASDNGYKVYLGGDGPGGGAQLVAPADVQIEQAAAAVGPAADIPLSDGWERLDGSVVAAYVDGAVAGAGRPSPPGAAPLVVAYTPLHGVGAEVLDTVFTRAGYARPVAVPNQREPDPAFPTVPFPNPEEPGALDAVLALGRRIGADLVLANDPDADRCAAAVGEQVLTGDEIGLLLADQVLRERPGPVATTVVSASALRSLAGLYGVPCAETLTGFKWIMRADPGLVFGYEEALGYAVAPGLVRDKDGITAALALARAAQRAKDAGRTLLDVLDDLQGRLGVHATGQVSARFTDLAGIAAVMRRLRATPPERVGGRPVSALRDLLVGGGGLPPSDVLIVELGDAARFVARPSGTEPKLKIYLQAVVGPAEVAAAGLPAARRRARSELAALRADVTALLDLPAAAVPPGEVAGGSPPGPC